MSRLRSDSFVEEVTLARNISDLRKALSGAAGERVYVETVPGRGYRFVAPVSLAIVLLLLTGCSRLMGLSQCIASGLALA
jgi:DNA-binding winged helix-turn-helix (wHTH) protein